MARKRRKYSGPPPSQRPNVPNTPDGVSLSGAVKPAHAYPRGRRVRVLPADRLLSVCEKYWGGDVAAMGTECGISDNMMATAFRSRKVEPDQAVLLAAQRIDGIKNIRKQYLLTGE